MRKGDKNIATKKNYIVLRQFFFILLACLYILQMQANNKQRATTPINTHEYERRPQTRATGTNQ
jgi:hypothetical protein